MSDAKVRADCTGVLQDDYLGPDASDHNLAAVPDILRQQARNGDPIVDISNHGTLICVAVRTQADFMCVITRRSLEEMSLRPDEEVHVAFNASDVHVF